MTLVDKAIKLIEENEIAEFFELTEKHLGTNNELSQLKKKFLANKHTEDFPDQLKIFAQSYLKNLSEKTQFLSNFTPIKDFVGREKDLKTLHNNLKAKQATVLVNGLGGVGKTFLARKYVTDFQAKYKNILWLEQQSSILEAFISEPRLIENQGFTQEKPLERFKTIIRFLENQQGKNLLVIDNYEKNEEDEASNILAYFKDIRFQDWAVLLTSREDIADFKTLPLDTLDPKEAKELFMSFIKSKTVNEESLHQLLKSIAYHTLTIELLAKTYENSWDLENLEGLIQILENKKLDDDKLEENIKIKASKQEIKLYTYLQSIFNIQKLNPEEIYILKQFAILPPLPIDGKQLLEWLDDRDRQYRPILESLAQKSWLSHTEGHYFEMHRLVQMLMLNVLKPSFEDNKALFDNILDLLDRDKVKANPLAHQWLVNYANVLLEHINFNKEEIKKSNLLNNLAYLFEVLGLYNQAEPLYEEALEIRKEVLGEKDSYYANSLNNLATLYYNQGKYAEAEALYKEVLNIIKEVLGKTHPNYASSLNNLASLYDKQGKYAEAEALYKEDLEITKEVLGEKHPDYATSLNNLAGLYDNQGKYVEAEALYKEALEIRKEVLGKTHPNYAGSLNNLAGLYEKQGEYDKSKKLHEEAIQIRKDTLGIKHPNYAQSLWWLGVLEYNFENFEQAESLISQTYQIFVEVLGKEHPRTQNCKEWLDAVRKKL